MWTTSRGGGDRPTDRPSAASVLLSGGEDNDQSTGGEDNRASLTFYVAGDKGTAPTLRYADQQKPKEETCTDGTRTSTPTAALKVPADCSAHLSADSSAPPAGRRTARRCTSWTTCEASRC